ncbi:MAG: phospholipase D-like domain-containing protein [Candidatus Gracilibacteria bacterium]|nr:phospholipase D-like domain-containing protein [Candidatus Gracilibacteria bacterium]
MKKLLLILLFFLFSCQNEYLEFHNEKQNEVQIKNELDSFSFDKIEYLSGIIIRETPDLKLLDDLVSKINNAKYKVYLEVYIFTEKRIKKALIEAKKKGIQVKVILEKNVYLASNLNIQTFKDLQKAGIEIVYSNPKNYALNHSKMMIIDNEIIISTGNYSYSTFKYNRDFFLFLDNQKYLQFFLDIFNNDFEGIKKDIYSNNIILSPFSSRNKLEYLINNAKESIEIYAENFSDENIINLLISKQKSGIQIKIILPDLKKVSSNAGEVELFKQNNINVKLLTKPEIHAKSILIDNKYLYIGSVNFSASSMDKNREVGFLIINNEIIKKFQDIFKDDFDK